MRRVLAALFLFVFASPAWAQQVKIGLIDLQRAINDSQPGKLVRQQLAARMKEAETEMTREKQEVEKVKADLDKKGPALKEDDRRKIEAELRRRIFNFQRKSRDLKSDLDKTRQDAEARILKELQAVIAEFAKSEKITYIFEKSQVLYSNQVPDITNKVIDLYNSRAASAKTAKGK